MTVTAQDWTDLQLFLAALPIGGLFVDEVVVRLGLEGDAEFKRKLKTAMKEANDATKGTETAFKKLGVEGGGAFTGLMTKVSSFGKALFQLRTLGVVLLARELGQFVGWLVKVGDTSKTLEPRIDKLGTAFKDRLAGVLQKTLIPVLDAVITRLEKIAGISPGPAVFAAKAADIQAKIDTAKNPGTRRRMEAGLLQLRLEAIAAAGEIEPLAGIGAFATTSGEGSAAGRMADQRRRQSVAFAAPTGIDIRPVTTEGLAVEAGQGAISPLSGANLFRGSTESLTELRTKISEATKAGFIVGPEAMEDRFGEALQNMQASLAAFGLGNKNVFGGLMNINAGFGGLSGEDGPFSGSKFAKSFSKTLTQIGFAGQIAAGAIGIIKGIGSIIGVGARDQARSGLQNRSDEDLQKLAVLASSSSSHLRITGEEAAAELKTRQTAATSGSQAFSSVATLTETQGNLILAVNETMRIQDAERNRLLTEIRDSSRNIEFFSAVNGGNLHRFMGMS